MRTEETIIEIFCKVSNELGDADYQHKQGRLRLSEIVTIGIIKSLSLYSFRRFYEWLKQFNLFDLNERSRLQRLVNKHWKHVLRFMKPATIFNITDSYSVELLHPTRENRKKQLKPIVRKGLSNNRWIIGRKINIVINKFNQIIDFDHDLAGGTDKVFNRNFAVINGIIFSDSGYNDKDKSKIPKNLKICKKGTWNDRMYIESLFSLWKRMLSTKSMMVKTLNGFSARTAYLCALTNILFDLNIKFGYNPFSMKQWVL